MTRTANPQRRPALLLALVLSGCASASVQPTTERLVAGLPAPDIVLVYPFAVQADQVTENQGLFTKVADSMSSTPMSAEQLQTAQAASNRLADDLVSGITKLGLFAQRAIPGMATPPNAVVVSGAFVDINEGNRLRRMVVGLGAGQATIDAKIRVMYFVGGNYQNLADYTAHVDSGEMPGAAITMGAGAAAQASMAGVAAANVAMGAAKGYESSVGPLIDRMANKVIVSLSHLFVAQGWISSAQAQFPSWDQL